MGGKVGRPRGTNNRTRTVGVRFTADELERLQRHAADNGMSLSAQIRALIGWIP